MTQGSLRRRVFLIGLMTVASALLIAGGGLVLLFEHHVERTLYDDLDGFVRQILGRLENDAVTGGLQMIKTASDPRFEKPFSGYYWQVLNSNGYETIRSKSLQDSILTPYGDCIADGRVRYRYIEGPAGETLLAGQMCTEWKGSRDPMQLRILAGIDLGLLRPARDAFTIEMMIGLFILGSVLIVATWLQANLGIAPLAKLREEVGEIARGERTRFAMVGPIEVEPLIDEMNALLDERKREIDRVRNHAADLAHGLKTPLAALVADSRLLREKGELEIAGSLERISDLMQRHVERELVRARAREGPRGRMLPKTPLAETVSVLIRTFARTGTQVEFDVHVSPTLMVAFDRNDLLEVIGNLLDNACRYANSLVRVSADREEDSVHLIIEDDGPGLHEGAVEVARQRGGRLDESGGAGLGLAIVQDVLDAYAATMNFSRSDLGGLRVSVDLSSGLAKRTAK
jgi:signal transduction histidine kinase